MWTDADGLQLYPAPREMCEAEIALSITDYAAPANLAIRAGFNGIEVHALAKQLAKYPGSTSEPACECDCRVSSGGLGSNRPITRINR